MSNKEEGINLAETIVGAIGVDSILLLVLIILMIVVLARNGVKVTKDRDGFSIDTSPVNDATHVLENAVLEDVPSQMATIVATGEMPISSAVQRCNTDTCPSMIQLTNSVSMNHIREFRLLRNEISGSIISSKEDIKALYTSFFRDFVISDDINRKQDLELYSKILNIALITIYIPKTKERIFGNHFPVKKRGESDQDFDIRFRNDYSIPSVVSISRLISDYITSEWGDIKATRIDYEAFIKEDERLKVTIDIYHNLVRKSARARDFSLEQIGRIDKSSFTRLKDEWEIVYG